MAVFTQNSGTMELFQPPKEWDVSKTAPNPGMYQGTCLAIKDEIGVEIPSFENKGQTEKQDRCAFLFGFRDAQGTPYKVATKWMRISGNEKSTLYQFLARWQGRPFPYGQDTQTLKQQKGTVNIIIGRRKDGSAYAMIDSVLPPMAQAPVAPAPVIQQATPTPAQMATAPSGSINGGINPDDIPF